MKLCECGCGKEVINPNKEYTRGHHPNCKNTGRTRFKKGCKPWNVGLTKENDTRILQLGLIGGLTRRNKTMQEKLKSFEKRKKTMLSRYGKFLGRKKGTTQTEKTKNKISKSRRITQIKYVEKNRLMGLPLIPQMGKYETQILNHIENKNDIKIIRQHRVTGYFLDGYDKENNIAYEIDEPFHFTEEKIINDKRRQLEIEQELGCQFVRIQVPK